MANNASNEAEASEIRRRGRRRLIGAIVLVALLVVFVPMLLDSEPRPSRPGPTAAIPPKENAAPLPPPSPAKASEKAAPVAAAIPDAPVDAPPAVFAAPPAAVVTTPPAAAPAEAPKPAQPLGQTAQPAVKTSPAPPSAAVPSKATQAAPLEGFAVQVGAFRDDEKLRQSREKLVAVGVVHYTERLDAKAGPLTRLRAGPFATREEAEAALVKLKRGAIEGKVVSLP